MIFGLSPSIRRNSNVEDKFHFPICVVVNVR